MWSAPEVRPSRACSRGTAPRSTSVPRRRARRHPARARRRSRAAGLPASATAAVERHRHGGLAARGTHMRGRHAAGRVHELDVRRALGAQASGVRRVKRVAGRLDDGAASRVAPASRPRCRSRRRSTSRPCAALPRARRSARPSVCVATHAPMIRGSDVPRRFPPCYQAITAISRCACERGCEPSQSWCRRPGRRRVGSSARLGVCRRCLRLVVARQIFEESCRGRHDDAAAGDVDLRHDRLTNGTSTSRSSRTVVAR